MISENNENTPMLFRKGTGILPVILEDIDSERATDDESCGHGTMMRGAEGHNVGQGHWYISALLLVVVLTFHHSFSSSTEPIVLRSPSHTTTIDWSALNDGSGAVLVTGATGRTGALLYHELKQRGVADVRALVRDADKARTALGCVACDETEGIYVGDLTEPKDIARAMADGSVKVLAVASGAGGASSAEVQRAVEFDAVVDMVTALGETNSQNNDALRVVFCSSMGTIAASPSFGGDILHWKLNAEAFLSSAAISSTVIIKPCGLNTEIGGNFTLVVGHHDELFAASAYYMVSRVDVANVMAEAVMMPHDAGKSDTLRFDLCSVPGPGTTDLTGLIDDARWEWDKQ
jgi:hypothetical protein